MATLRESALEYEGKTTKNIAELKKFPANLEVQEFKGETGEGKEFSYNFVEVDGEQYRVPNTVLKQMKALLEDKPDIEEFKVKKSGEGMKTEYMVIAV